MWASSSVEWIPKMVQTGEVSTSLNYTRQIVSPCRNVKDSIQVPIVRLFNAMDYFSPQSNQVQGGPFRSITYDTSIGL